jgi:hypothetical protein
LLCQDQTIFILTVDAGHGEPTHCGGHRAASPQSVWAIAVFLRRSEDELREKLRELCLAANGT